LPLEAEDALDVELVSEEVFVELELESLEPELESLELEVESLELEESPFLLPLDPPAEE
jgi:hypothetical protein